MKILVYGCGVIGSLLVHILCRAGNEVTVVSKGAWGDVLKEDGLRIYHQLQHKYTTDHPKVERSLPDEHFDIAFSVMQGIQQTNVLPELARADVPVVVLVGNNLNAAETENQLLELSDSPKSVLFGFQGTAGLRGERSVNCLHIGKGSMTVGGLHRELTADEKALLDRVFYSTGYKLVFEDDMEGWLWCHAAFILPIVYESYKCRCDLRKASSKDITSMLNAVEEAYDLIKHSGKKIRPKGDEMLFKSKLKMSAMKAMFYVISKTKIGELAATDHCRNAVPEMEWLDLEFEKLRRDSAFHMPEWEVLRNSMPEWEDVHEMYDGNRKKEVSRSDNTILKIAAAIFAIGGMVLVIRKMKKKA